MLKAWASVATPKKAGVFISRSFKVVGVSGFRVSVFVGSGVVDMYVKCGGSLGVRGFRVLGVIFCCPTIAMVESQI
jgi:hypothetical protein